MPFLTAALPVRVRSIHPKDLMRSNYISRPITLLSVASLAISAACGSRDAQQASATPAREIQLAPAGAAQPQLNDAPLPQQPAPNPAPAPVSAPAPTRAPEVRRPAPVRRRVAQAPDPSPTPRTPVVPVAPIAAAPAPSLTGTIDAGRTLAVNPSARICTNTHHAGDRFTTTLSEAVQGSDGVSIPAGSVVTLRVVESARSEHSKDNIKFSFDVVSVRVGEETYDVDGRVKESAPLEKVRAQSTGDQAKKVGAGAAIGAIAGQILGRNTKSTIIGGVVGAAAGTAVAAGTADYDGCLPTTAVLRITLNRPLLLKIPRKSAY